MDTKKKRSGGFGSIFFMIIIIGIVWAVIAQMSQRTSNYKYKDFESDLKSGRITDVVISQNAEVPTGTLTITFTDGSRDTLNVSDVVSVTAIGHKLRTHQKAVAGQDIVMTKHIGMSGIRTVISHKRDEILNVLPEDVINKAFAADEELIIAKEAQIFIKQNIDGAMHDASEGGIFAALWDMAEYSGTGLDIDLRHISVKQEIIEICELFNINPYILDSMGCLLMTCENGCDIVNIMKQNGIEAAVIGKITDGNNRIIHNTEEDRYLGLPEQDEIYRFI